MGGEGDGWPLLTQLAFEEETRTLAVAMGTRMRVVIALPNFQHFRRLTNLNTGGNKPIKTLPSSDFVMILQLQSEYRVC